MIGVLGHILLVLLIVLAALCLVAGCIYVATSLPGLDQRRK